VLRYVGIRVVEAVFAVWGVATLVFFLIRLSGDPVVLMLPPGSSKEAVAGLRHQLGLDAPLMTQYARFLGELISGQFPESLVYGRNSLFVVLERLPATALLAVCALALGVAFGAVLGLVSARVRGRAAEVPVTALTVIGQAVPTFWFGLMLIMVFAVALRWFPVGGIGGVNHLVLPAITLALYSMASIGRMFRVSLLAISDAHFIRTAHAKGISPRRVLGRHIVPNALLPVVTVVGLQAGQLLGGAVVTEVVFAWPGVGQLLITAINNHDFPVIQSAILLIAVVFVVVNLVTDLLYGMLDPRVRIGGHR
jgi:peptide/nickel transport system permease protein